MPFQDRLKLAERLTDEGALVDEDEDFLHLLDRDFDNDEDLSNPRLLKRHPHAA